MLDDALRVGIYVPTRVLPAEEIEYLLKREEVSALALKRLLANEISWPDYLDVMETCGIDVDEYLITCEHNCKILLA